MKAPAAAQASAPLLSLHGCSVQLGDARVLNNISLTIHPGERVALVGPNGSGKTTLLRALHGLLPCVGGHRELARTSSGHAVRLAMLFQKPFVLSLSAQVNIRLALWLQGWSRAERRDRADEALHRVGLAPQARQRATTLSGGQQQRLALARAWALRPDLLLLDEPTASLDPSAKREVEALMAAFAADGLTVIFSSHNLGQVKRLATRVIYLEGGSIPVDAPVDQFFGGPLPADVRAFLKGELAWA